MYKRVGLLVVVIVIAFFIFPSVLDMLFALLFIGVVPGISYILPANVMIVLDALLLALAARAIIRQMELVTNAEKRDAKNREKARKKVLKTTVRHSKQTARPKKRYSTIIEP